MSSNLTHPSSIVQELSCTFAPARIEEPGHAGPPIQPAAAPPAPLPRERLVQVAIDRTTYAMLQYARALLSHQVPSGSVSEVLRRALEPLISQLEKRKFAATDRPRPGNGATPGSRHIPSAVKRDVWRRDGGRCTFVGDTGHRCGSTWLVEYEHLEPHAHGGQATVENITLRCRSHNALAAERALGRDFMLRKREAAAAERARLAEERRQAAETESDPDRSVIPWLRALGVPLDRARLAAEHCEQAHPGVPLEERVRKAIAFGRKPEPTPSIEVPTALQATGT
jgi:hypothetical protein